MAIKGQCEQCSKCRKNAYGLKCTEYGREPVYNDEECLHFSEMKAQTNRHNIDLTKRATNDNSNSVVPHHEEEVHGWLSFALFAIVSGGIVSFVYSIVTANGNSGLLNGLSIIEGALFFGLAVYAAVQVYNKKTNGIFLMKAYIIACFFSNLLGILLFDSSQADVWNNQTRMVRSTIWAVIWFCYLTFSPQVKRIFPKDSRKVYLRDKVIVGFFFAYPIILFLIGILIGVSNPSLLYGDEMKRYVEKVSSWNLPQTKDTEVSYDRKNNILQFKQKLQIDEIYADNPKYIATLKKMDKMLSENSVAILAIESMTLYDSLVEKLDAAKADFSFTICLPDGTVILNKDFDYNFLSSIDENAKRNYQEEKLLFQFETANSICPFEIEEGLWCKSVQFRKDFNIVEYTYQLQVDTPWLKTADYNQLLDDIYGTLPAESLKAMGITVRLFLNNKNGDQLTNMEY